MNNNRTKENIENDINENIEGKYNQVIAEITNIKVRLSDLRRKKELLPYSNNKKINIVVSVVGLLTFLFLVSFYIKLFINSQVILTNIIWIFVGIPIIGLVDVVFFKKIMRVLQLKSYNKIVNSLEYEQLMEEIKSTSKLLDERLLEETLIVKEMLEYKSKLAVIDAERNIRSALCSYSDDSFNNTRRRIRTRIKLDKRDIK